MPDRVVLWQGELREELELRDIPGARPRPKPQPATPATSAALAGESASPTEAGEQAGRATGK